MKKYVYKYKRCTGWDVKKQKYNYKTLCDTRVSPILKCKTEQGLDMEVFITPSREKKGEFPEWDKAGVYQYCLRLHFPNGEWGGGLPGYYIDTLMQERYYTDLDGTKTKMEDVGLGLYSGESTINNETLNSWKKLIQDFIDENNLPLDKENKF